MGKLRAGVENGRLIVNEPTDLPEGTVLDLIIDDEGDDLSTGERERLHAALERGIADALSGRSRSSDSILEGLRREG